METIVDLARSDWPAFLLVFFRVSGVMMLAPVFGSAMAPAPVKIFLSLVLSLLFFPLVGGQNVPMDGGLLALGIEEAALSLTPGASLASLDVRYLQPVRVGPVVARAEVRGGLGRVEVRDAGNDDRLSVVATTRTF